MSHGRQNFHGGYPKRASLRRSLKRTILIVGEGRETEPNYFRELKTETAVAAKFAITVKKGPGFSATNVVNKTLSLKEGARRRKENYDEIWCVLDVETSASRKDLNEAMKIARENDLQICLSNPCFEVWILSHFVRHARAYNNCDAVIVELNPHWQREFGQEYQKNDEHIYPRLKDKTSAAVSNAEWVRETHHCTAKSVADCNSSTEVYKLVKYLLGLS
jgi:hypothetical protein